MTAFLGGKAVIMTPYVGRTLCELGKISRLDYASGSDPGANTIVPAWR